MSALIVEISKISEIKAHPNADKLELAIIKGWQCIVGKGQHKVNELVVYCPPDSIIPPYLVERYKLEFLKKNGKVGTIKLRGEVSQGLVLEIPQEIRKENYSEGKDVASVLGITKYEPPERPCGVKGGGQVTKKKSNPLFDKYTDIQNIKHFPDLFKEGEDIVITEKIHGSNFRAGLLPRPNRSILAWFLNLFNKYEFVYGSHMVQKKPLSLHKGYYKEDIWLEMVHKYNLDKIIPKDYIVYGEVYGCGVQDLVYDCPNEHNLMIFDIKYKGKYLDWDKVKLFCTHFQLPIVPTLLECRYTYDTVKLCTDGKSVVCPTQIREGCIVKPAVEVEIAEYNGRAFGRKILKSVSVDYLTRKEGTEYH